MAQIFTDEWIKLVDAEIQNKLRDFNWEEFKPETPLFIIYKIGGGGGAGGGGDFTYHISCTPDECRVFAGEPADSQVSNVVFSQSYETAVGIIKGELNTHIEFLMGKIEVSGDVLELEAYSKALAQIQECFARFSD